MPFACTFNRCYTKLLEKKGTLAAIFSYSGDIAVHLQKGFSGLVLKVDHLFKSKIALCAVT